MAGRFIISIGLREPAICVWIVIAKYMLKNGSNGKNGRKASDKSHSLFGLLAGRQSSRSAALASHYFIARVAQKVGTP